MDTKSSVSQTAMLIASLRALACYEDDLLIHGNDSLAELFLPEEKRRALRSSDTREAIKKAIPEGLYEYVIARTRYFDELFSNLLRRRVPQVVLLGAGYDSRAYRFADPMEKSEIFEVDASSTQNAKRRILQENAVTVHPNVSYVTADFEQGDWFRGLFEAGYQSSLRTLYIWEGVTFYLTPETVDSTLALLRQNSLPGSILSFDYQHKDEEHALIDTGLQEENVKFGLDVHTCDSYLQRRGYSVIEKVDSETLAQCFLTMSDGKRFGEVKSIMNIVTAEIN